jgi:hypothetical protein
MELLSTKRALLDPFLKVVDAAGVFVRRNG